MERDRSRIIRILLIVFLFAGSGCDKSPKASSTSTAPETIQKSPTLISTRATEVQMETATPIPTQIAVPEPVIPEYDPLSADGAGRIIHIPSDYPTIQVGIQQAADGDLVLVAPGTYLEQINFLGKTIKVTSERGPEVTIIDGGRAGHVVTFQNGETPATALHGFTITGGLASSQGENPSTYSSGGGLLILNASPLISHCWITENAANFGGGGLIEGAGASPILRDNRIFANIAGERGGGLQIKRGATPVIQNNLITENIAMDAAGLEVIIGSSGVIEKNLIARNVSGYDFSEEHLSQYLDGEDVTRDLGQSLKIPGGLVVSDHSSPDIWGNRIIENQGGGMGVFLGSSPKIERNVIQNNRGSLADGVLIGSESTPQISNNLIEGSESPAVRGDETVGISDTAGNLSLQEFTTVNSVQGEVLLPVKSQVQTGTSTGNTIKVPEDFPRVQQAIESAKDGDTIIVDPGIYEEELNFRGKSITVRSTAPNDPETVQQTVLQGSEQPTVMFNSGESALASLEGFTILNSGQQAGVQISHGSEPTIKFNHMMDITSPDGAVSIEKAGSPLIFGNRIQNNQGGGIKIFYSSPVVENNQITGNSSEIGGGINAYLSSPVIRGNILRENYSQGIGSAIQIEHYSTGSISENIISDNVAEVMGTISLDDFAHVTIDRNIIVDNDGEGISAIFDSHPLIVNNFIARNVHGGIFVGSSTAELINNTLVDNTKGGADASATESWGIFVLENSRVSVVNTILDESKIVLYDPYSQVDVSYSLFHDQSGAQLNGPGVIIGDPGLTNRDDYQLAVDSVCVDNGLSVEITEDIEGDLRPIGEGFDIGADELTP